MNGPNSLSGNDLGNASVSEAINDEQERSAWSQGNPQSDYGHRGSFNRTTQVQGRVPQPKPFKEKPITGIVRGYSENDTGEIPLAHLPPQFTTKQESEVGRVFAQAFGSPERDTSRPDGPLHGSSEWLGLAAKLEVEIVPVEGDPLPTFIPREPDYQSKITPRGGY